MSPCRMFHSGSDDGDNSEEEEPLEECTDEVPEELPEYLIDEISGYESEEIPEEVPEQLGDDVSEKLPTELFNDSAEEVTEEEINWDQESEDSKSEERDDRVDRVYSSLRRMGFLEADISTAIQIHYTESGEYFLPSMQCMEKSMQTVIVTLHSKAHATLYCKGLAKCVE